MLSGRSIESVEAEYEGHGYGGPQEHAEVVDSSLSPIRARTLELLDDPAELDRLLDGAAERANEVASATLKRVYDAMGLLHR